MGGFINLVTTSGSLGKRKKAVETRDEGDLKYLRLSSHVGLLPFPVDNNCKIPISPSFPNLGRKQPTDIKTSPIQVHGLLGLAV